MKKGATGYRVGYYVDLTNGSVLFGMVHSPVMAQLFKRNLVFSTFESVIERTAHFRDEHYVYWSSRFRRGDDFQNGAIQCASLEEFLTSLREFDAKHGFVKDLFPSIGNRGNGDGRARWAGNTFYLLLSDDLKQFSSDIKVEQLVDLSWPIFLCLYPVEALTQRTASLARNLRTAKIAKVCEFNVIKLPPTSKIAADCRGEIQGAHIIPDAKGGSDRPENGLWLCEYHHRVTEGRLIGRRVGLSVDVELLSNKW